MRELVDEGTGAGKRRQPQIAATAAMGALIRNVQRHPTCSTSRPPTLGPMIAPMGKIDEISPITRVRFGPWNASPMIP
jgi:hypothetical protein